MKITSSDDAHAKKSYTVVVVADGEQALFTQAGTNADPVSHIVPPPSAAAGILRAIFWKPAFDFNIKRIELLRFGGFKSCVEKGVSAKDMACAHKHVLRNITYIDGLRVRITADIVMLSPELVRQLNPGYVDDGRENAASYYEQFKRKCMRGQHYSLPNFGSSNMPCSYTWAKPRRDNISKEAAEAPLNVSQTFRQMPLYRLPTSRRFVGSVDNTKNHHALGDLEMVAGVIDVKEQYRALTRNGEYRNV